MNLWLIADLIDMTLLKDTIKRQSDIVRINGMSNYSLIHLTDGKMIMACDTLKRFEEALPFFVRTGKSHLINPNYVKRISVKLPNLFLLMQTDEQIPISRRRIDDVLSRLSYGADLTINK